MLKQDGSIGVLVVVCHPQAFFLKEPALYMTLPSQQLTVGRLVLVPFRDVVAVGVIVEVCPEGTVMGEGTRMVQTVLDDVVPQGLVALALFVCRRTATAGAIVFQKILPAKLRDPKTFFVDTSLIVVSQPPSQTGEDTSTSQKRTTKQQECLEYLLAHGGSASAVPVGPSVVQKGIALWLWTKTRVQKMVSVLPPVPTCLTEWQAHGKLFVYGLSVTQQYNEALRLCLDARDKWKQVRVVFPTLRMMTDWYHFAQERLSDISVFDTADTPKQRFETFCRCMSGAMPVLVGTSALAYAPVGAPTVWIVVQPSHPVYRPMSAPRIDILELLSFRSTQEASSLVCLELFPSVYHFAGVTHSPEWNVTQSTNTVTASFRVIDMLRAPKAWPGSVFSAESLSALEQTFADWGSSLCVLHRRWFAHVVQCETCGHVLKCPHCDVGLVFSQQDGSASCSLCGYRQDTVHHCSSCGWVTWRHARYGIEKVLEDLQKRFPHQSLVLLPPWWEEAHTQLWHKRDAPVVFVATRTLLESVLPSQIKTILHLDADQWFFYPDYRAEEESLRALFAVAASGADQSTILMQMYGETHIPFVSDILNFRIDALLQHILHERAQHGFPPYRSILRLTVWHADEHKAEQKMQTVSAFALEFLGSLGECVGPYPTLPRKQKGLFGFECLLLSSISLLEALALRPELRGCHQDRW